MSVYGTIFFGNFIQNPEELCLTIPFFRQKYSIRYSMSRDEIIDQILTNQTGYSSEQNLIFKTTLKNRIMAIFYNLRSKALYNNHFPELNIGTLVDYDGTIEFYLGIEIVECELKEPWKIEEIPFNDKNVKNVKKFFHKYRLIAPKYFLVEAIR